ncbi:hypothetical protein, partial [Rubritalea marina]|uniref:hypothetical protein n=1 Tax=Rubritalea marina TaxID=361055 RepID=UPI001969C897
FASLVKDADSVRTISKIDSDRMSGNVVFHRVRSIAENGSMYRLHLLILSCSAEAILRRLA